MKKIQVLGPGCPNCEKLAQATMEAAYALGIEHEFEKVTDIQKIMSFGVMMTPALVVDGQVKVSGKVPSVEEIKKLLA
ncbi:MAG: thioredoxin family protein [candidate division Zixibacteria bacterium]|nr:thioredoxin family protein [candidate division Zixibacteria bacterium]